MRLYWHELKGELLLYTRSRELAFFTFLLPMVFFVLLGGALLALLPDLFAR